MIYSIPFAGRGSRRGEISIPHADPAVPDADLVKQFLGGDEAGFAALVDRHASGVYSFVYRYLGNADDANDVTQETFIRVWKHIKRFDVNRNFRTWILAIAKNASLDLIKKKKPVLFSRIEEGGEQSLDTFLAPYVESPELPDAALVRGDEKRGLEVALQQLPPAYRIVLVLRYSQYLKFREIADVLGEPIDTVKSKHRRGLMLLRKAYRT